MLKYLSKLGDLFLDYIAPKKCYSCKKEGYFLCLQCFEKIGYFEENCPRCREYSLDFETHFYCKKEDFYIDKLIILTHYKNKYIKKLVRDAKFHHKKLIYRDFTRYMGVLFLKYIHEDRNNIILIPTPMYFLKKNSRGYNQREILTRYLGNKYNYKYDFKIVKKIKNTKPQAHLSKLERLENLHGVFKINKKRLDKYKDKTFIIIDDVTSTKTTLNKVSEVLKKSGVKRVYSMVIASD